MGVRAPLGQFGSSILSYENFLSCVGKVLAALWSGSCIPLEALAGRLSTGLMLRSID